MEPLVFEKNSPTLKTLKQLTDDLDMPLVKFYDAFDKRIKIASENQ